MERIRVEVGSAAVEIVRLKERHGEIERRLSELDRHLSLTPDEQIERARLKKEKLRMKDRMLVLAQLGDPAPVSSAAPALVTV